MPGGRHGLAWSGGGAPPEDEVVPELPSASRINGLHDRQAERTADTGQSGYLARMGRSYSLPTIKTLFGEASSCAYPDCDEPLIFHDRGATTVVAQIAHIRSASPKGPRHDPDYARDVDGHENLLLLCGKHHPPVDRHESIYSVEELEAWKERQVDEAGSGTSISDEEAKRFTALSDEERQAIVQCARLAQRVATTAEAAQAKVADVDHQHRAAQKRTEDSVRGVMIFDDEGRPAGSAANRIEMAPAKAREFDGQRRAIVSETRPAVQAAANQLAEEVAVLKMMAGPSLGRCAHSLMAGSQLIVDSIGDEDALSAAKTETDARLAQLWDVANGAELLDS